MDERYTQIEKYLDGQLTPVERAAFEKKLSIDKDFAMEVEQFKDLMGGLRLRNNKELKNRLNEIHEQVVTPPTTAVVRPLKRKWWYAIAAAACLLLLVALFLFRGGGTNPDVLYATYYEPYEPDWTTRGTENTSITTQVKNLYEAKDYDDLSKVLKVDSLQSQLSSVKFTMIKGITSLENNQYEEARQYFKTAADNPVIQPEAQWYTALSYLKEKDIDNCKKILAQFAEDKASDYYREALNILKEL